MLAQGRGRGVANGREIITDKEREMGSENCTRESTGVKQSLCNKEKRDLNIVLNTECGQKMDQKTLH